MITFDIESTRFNFRTAGVAIDDGHVLIHRAEHETFWSLPGGRVDMLEPAATALAREMREELGAAVAVGDLLWTIENFFEHDGWRCHELGMYFRMTMPPALSPRARPAEFDGYEPTVRLIYRWHPIDRLDDIVVLPAFLAHGLRRVPDAPAHVVQLTEGNSGVRSTTTTL